MDMRLKPTPASGLDAGAQSFSASELHTLASFSKKLTFTGPGIKIFDQGEAAQKLYLLTEGVVRISRLLSDGSRHVLEFKWPGGFFGLKEEGVFANHAHTLTPCVIYEFESETFTDFLLAHPSIQQKVLQRAIYHISSTYRQVIIVGRFGTKRALAAFLLDCAGKDGFFDEQTSCLSLPMSRYDIADYLGTAAESVTRAITRLETEGLLKRCGPRELILNLAGLKRLANIE